MNDPQSITISLSGKWHGYYGVAACPVCQPERRKDQSALTISSGESGLLAYCHKSGCAFRDIAAELGLLRGTPEPQTQVILRKERRKRYAEAACRSRQASDVWAETRPIACTIAETYLRGRGITCGLGDTLRFHPAAWHGATAQRLPALVAMVEGSDEFAIHRTYLDPDDCGKADVVPNKVMLGSVAAGSVRLSAGGGSLVVAEGIETALIGQFCSSPIQHATPYYDHPRKK